MNVFFSSCWNRRSSICISFRSFSSSVFSTSSRSKTSGAIAMLRAIATRWRSPPESSQTRRFCFPSRSTNRNISSTLFRRSSLSIPRTLRPYSTFSSAVMCGNSAYSWKMRLVFRRSGGARVMSLPAMTSSPAYQKSMGFRVAVERKGGPSNRGRRGRRAGELFLMNWDDEVIAERVEGPKLIEFIGLGNMGAPLASNLLKAGFPVVVWNRTESKARPLVEKGATWADGPRHLAEKSDVVITMLEDARAVREVLLGAEGVVAAKHPNLRIIDMSTISPKDSRDIAQQVADRGMIMIDSPVSGSVKAAADASLTVLVGGEPEVVESVLPILRAMGKNVFHLGPNGMGCYMKLVNNVVLAASLAGFSEAFVLGKKAGLPPQQMLDVILQGSARSPLLEFKGKAIVDRNFAPTFALRLMRKDLGLALETGSQTQVPMPITAFLNELHQAAIAGGLADRDWSAIVQVFEGLAGVS